MARLFRATVPSCLLVLVFMFCLNNWAYAQKQFVGVNLAGAEFGDHNLPGTYNQHYTYPTHAEVDYFVYKGMNAFRLPFKWERLQHSANEDLNPAELARISSFVNYAASQDAYTILDPHNYARYYGDVIGTKQLPASAFEDFWRRLSLQFKDDHYVISGLMNEPYGMTSELWLADANAAISAIRSTGAGNLILVPGNAYTGAHSWTANWYGTPNSTVMLNIIDPADNYAFEVHQYLDDNSSGTSDVCVNSTIGSTRLKSFTKWLRDHKKRGFLGEFGISNNDNCLQSLDNMLEYIDENSDVWLGWTYWAAGPWWGDYMFSVEPKNGEDRPQMAILEKHSSVGSNVSGHSTSEVETFSLYQNYPNPFNGATQIEFEMPESDYVELNVYNVLGDKISCLLAENLASGRHAASWDGRHEMGENVAGGIYFYALKIGRNNNTKVMKMLLIQ